MTTPKTTEVTAAVTPEATLKAGVTFTRKITDGNYGSTEASVYLALEVSPDADADEVSAALQQRFNVAALTVFDTLGIVAHMDDEGVIRESLSAVTPARAEQAFSAPSSDASPAPQAPAYSLKIMNEAESRAFGPLDPWIRPAAESKGITAIWDNRATVRDEPDRNLPHYREAVAKGATGQGKAGKAFGFYPPDR